MSSFDPLALREAFGAYITGITVVTTYDQDGNPRGFTANSFTSVSLDPALVLVCITADSPCLNDLKNSQGFAINVLSETQQDVSQTFATPVDDRFASVNWRKGPHQFPIFEGVSAWFDCSMHEMVEAGDHIILIGKVEAFENGLSNGLGYARGAYFTPSHQRKALSALAGDHAVVSAIIERDGHILMLEKEGKLCLPHTRFPALKHSEPATSNDANAKTQGSENRLSDLLDVLGIQATVGFIYSVYENTETQEQHIVYRCIAKDGEPAQGQFKPLTQINFESLPDAATESMLRRYAQESRVGNYSIYMGDQHQGTT